MSETAVQAVPLNNAVWNAWIEKGKRIDQSMDRKVTVAGAIIIALYAIGATFYVLMSR